MSADDLIAQADAAPDLREMHRLRAALSRAKSDRKSLLQQLEDADARLELHERMVHAKPPKPIKKKRAAGRCRQATAVLMCSDWHLEETVLAETVNGANHYNLAESTRRVDRLAEGAVWRVQGERSSFDVRNLIVWAGGDLMTGHIHPELMEQNSLSPIEATLHCQDRITALIDRLVNALDPERIQVLWDHGNHGRTTIKTRKATSAKNSYEWGIGQQVARHYANHPVVSVSVNPGRVGYADIYGWKLRHTHGDDIRSSGGVGGIFPAMFKQLSRWDTHCRADVTILGHFHTYQALPHVVTNGSLIGVSPYAMSFAHEQPQQAFFMMDSERGHKADYGLEVAR